MNNSLPGRRLGPPMVVGRTMMNMMMMKRSFCIQRSTCFPPLQNKTLKYRLNFVSFLSSEQINLCSGSLQREQLMECPARVLLVR